MTEYVNSLAIAISTYLFYANTYQFTVLEGKNSARNALRNMFDTDDLQYLQLLGQRLDGLPIPPRLYNELAHFYAIYHTSEYSSTSSTYSFTPLTLTGEIESIDTIPTSTTTQGIRYCLSAQCLGSATFEVTCDMMARVMPEWLEVKVGSSQYNAHMYDADHLNVFANSPGVSSSPGTADSTVRYTPTWTSVTQSADQQDKHYIAFNAHSRELRGDQQAMWSAKDEGSISEDWSGFLVPVVSNIQNNTQTTNRFKFATLADGSEEWIMDNYNPSTFFSQGGSNIYANTFDNTALQESTPMGSYRLLGMNPVASRIPQDQYLSFLLDIDINRGERKRNNRRRR